MNTLPQKAERQSPPASDGQMPRSIGQVIEDHLDEIVGPETAAKVRKLKKVEE
jgi:hypothetical protein